MRIKTVLILQDEKEQSDGLREKIEESSIFEVIGVLNDGISAISMVADKSPDFLITGLVIPGYDGISVISRIREQNKNIKIIV